ncbi:hypothetical protein DFH08DRAFT_944500 [Mycena albidolilacea]|uniref:DUF6699 domain-containing protein n=1 Tax=Mycena albidolilacea TaxID=1033008 RepID=A0AAD6Z5H7_9AGAR|nr:hypothetical protein DFH08DRAFT_944500 [Mycena albidolilacea]
MTKTVHFSRTNILYSPLPWSSSPGASTSSLPPSPAATALPQLADSPSATAIPSPTHDERTDRDFPSPAPVVYSLWGPPVVPFVSPRKGHIPIQGRTQIHSLLAFAPFAPPAVDHDLSHPLRAITPQLTPSFFNPATYPALPALTVLCRHLAWPIAVFPSQLTGFVSVLDVFMSVHTSLRLAACRAEYDTLPSGDVRRGVDYAYFRRCGLLTDEEERTMEALQGVKRVDFLEGKTRFLGLSGPMEGEHVWELNVA